jgi:Fic family protein
VVNHHCFIGEFLAIHPFQDGNGRLSRVLTTCLLLRCRYAYVPYSPLEAVIEHSKEGYYLALRQTQKTIKSDVPNWQPWVLFSLKALKQQKQRLEVKLEREKLLMGILPERSLKIMEITKSRGRITMKDILSVTGANRNMIKKHLGSLVENRYLQQNATGKGTWYSINE